MSATSRAAGRSPGRALPFNLHVSICAIVPLTLAFLASAFIWDVFCFNCDRQSEWRASVLESADIRAPRAGGGEAASTAAQGDGLKQDGGGTDGDHADYEEVLDYLLGLELSRLGSGGKKERSAGGGKDATTDAGATATPGKGGERSAGQVGSGESSDYEEVLDYLLGLELPQLGSGGQKEKSAGGGKDASTDAGATATKGSGGKPEGERSAGRGEAGERAAAAASDTTGDNVMGAFDDAGVMGEDAGDADGGGAEDAYDDYDAVVGLDRGAGLVGGRRGAAGRRAGDRDDAPGQGAADDNSESVADEADDVEEETSPGAAARVPYDDYDTIFGVADTDGAAAAGRGVDRKGNGGAARKKPDTRGQGGAAESGGGLDEPESEDDYEPLYGNGAGDALGGGGGVGPGAQVAIAKAAGDASADSAGGGEEMSQLDEPTEDEDYEPLYGEDGRGAGGGDTAVQGTADGKASADAADDVEGIGPEHTAPGGQGESGYKYGFKLLPPGSVKYGDVAHCPEAGEPLEAELRPVHPGMNLLMVVGVQKGGTTWMANALMQHPAIVSAQYSWSWAQELSPMPNRPHRKIKEVHYLDRWPHFNGSEANYISLFPQYAAARKRANEQLKAAGVPLKSLKTVAGTRAAYDHLSHEFAFFDASPNYLPVAHVPPRASVIMPHARIVIVLRDPVARALSAYNMDRGRFCGTGKKPATFFLKDAECPETAFGDTVEAATGVEARGDKCAFDGLDQGGPQTWHDCFKCSHMFFNRTHCLHQPPPRPFNGCKPDVLNYVQVSNYAAQIAWWLAFYPPEQILIITSSELRDPGRQVNALNRILKHAKIPNAKRFSKKWLAGMDINGFKGTYDEDDSATGVPEAIATLRQRLQKPVEDLRHLINRFWPQMKFTGLQDEV